MTYPYEIIPGTAHPISIDKDTVPTRIDLFLCSYFERYSRSFFKKLIEDGLVARNDQIVQKESVVVRPGDHIVVTFPALRDRKALIEAARARETGVGSDHRVDILFEHKDFIIINKPSRLVVHAPSQQSTMFTLSDWLVMKFDELEKIGYEDRPGIVHRLDRDTTGIMIIPRTGYAHARIAAMFKDRTITKTYTAIVEKHPARTGSIQFPISRHPTNRNRMTHLISTGRPARTTYTVERYFADHALLNIRIFTGRTHQIRVHCAAIEHPIVGDPIYGHKSKQIDRQALHAHTLAFDWDGTPYQFTAPLPADMTDLIQLLEKNSSQTSELERC